MIANLISDNSYVHQLHYGIDGIYEPNFIPV